jgi:DNA-directed RNA polymerase specialized sigma24 family protein
VSAETDEEFRKFMRGRWPAMVRLAYGLTGDQGHAEDVAQAAFARTYASWARVVRTGDPDAYVRRIVINENRARFRKRRVTENLVGAVPERPGQPAADPTADTLGDSSTLMNALRRLGPRQRAVGTVKSQASRALAALRGSAELKEGELQ